MRLKDDNGTWYDDNPDLCRIAKDYFVNLFSTSPGDYETVLSSIRPKISAEMNETLFRPFNIDEFKSAIFQMHPDKSPGSDGFNPVFYHKCWNLISDEVFNTCSGWLNRLEFPLTLNNTNIVLISKYESPVTMKDLQSISLCNVIYKIMVKVLANRLKYILPGLISRAQSTLVLGRSITDNILMAFEVIHHLKRKTKENKDEVALKIDISKAYDHVE